MYNKSGIIYINLPNIPFKVVLVNLEAINFIKIIQTNKYFKIDIDKPSFVFKDIPFYVFIHGFYKGITLSKCVIKALKNKLNTCEF